MRLSYETVYLNFEEVEIFYSVSVLRDTKLLEVD